MLEARVTPSSLLAAGDCAPTNSTILILISVMSLLGCLYVIGTYLYVPALRQHPAGIMFGMSVYCAVYQFLFLIDQASESIECSKMGTLVDFFLTGQETYMLIFAIDLLLALKNPFSTSKGQMTKYHIYGGLWSILFAFISHFDTHFALFGFCWMHSSTISEKPMISYSTLPTSGIFFALYIVVVYCTSLCAILRTWNTFLKGLRDTFKTRQRIHRHLKYYVGCYFGYWTLVLACYALFSIIPKGPTNLTATSDASPSMRCRIWHFLSCLILSKGMVNAVIWTRTSNILKIIHQLREFGHVDLPPQDESINWALRLEILTNTTKGICESIDRAERQARVSCNSSICSVNSAVLSPNAAIAMNGMHDVTVNINARAPYFGMDNGRDTNSYTQIEEIILENRSDSRLRGAGSEGVAFFDYAPHVFRRLRMQAKISCAHYRNSFRQTTKERVSEGKSGAFFYFTEDRKYVVKTLTHEELNFLLSILPKYYTFIQNNPNTFVTRFFGCHAITMYGKTMFFMVMQSVFDTTLQIHERFDLKGSWVGRLEGRKPTGTIANCKFCNKDYVVGGSHNQLCEARRGEGNLRHQYDQVGKDLNWNRHMALPRESTRKVARQLILDSNFLSKINCIDYSLLVGVHHRSFNVSHYSSADNFDIYGGRVSRTGGVPVSDRTSGLVRNSNSYPDFARESMGMHQNSKPFHQATHGGMSVDEVHGPGIYFMGLIDILQQWNFRKRLEHFVRVYLLWQDKKGISVVNPKEYAERFQQRVVRELIYDASQDRTEIYPIRLTTPVEVHHVAPVLISPQPQMLEPIQSAITLDFNNEDSSSFAATTVSMETPLPITVTSPPVRCRATSCGSRDSVAYPVPIRLSSLSPSLSALFPATSCCSRNSFDMVYPSYVDYSLSMHLNLSPRSSAKRNSCEARNSMISIGRSSDEEEIERYERDVKIENQETGLSSVIEISSSCSGDSIGLSLDADSSSSVQDGDGGEYRIVHSPTYPEKSIVSTRSA